MKQRDIYNQLFNRISKNNTVKSGVLLFDYGIRFSKYQRKSTDIAYFLNNPFVKGQTQIPDFVIIIITNNFTYKKIGDKLNGYFEAGVKVVWSVFPDPKSVHIYTSRKNVQICTDDDICSAKPVLPAFEISVNDIFALKSTQPAHAE